MYSGFFHIFREPANRFFKRLPEKALLMTSIVSALFFFAFVPVVPVVKAENEISSPTVDSVNLRQDKWTYSVYSDKNSVRYAAVTRYDGDELTVQVPGELGGYPVKVISREAFCGNQYLTSVDLPDSVSEIGKYAFCGCIGLGNVSFPASLVNIGEGAFYGCWSLTEASLPEGTSKIGSFAFYNCRHLKKAVFPPSLRSIGDSAFEGCGMLGGVSFGDNLEKIGNTAFKGCASITQIDLSAVGELGVGTFVKCTALEKAVLGEKITHIRPETFRGCESLTNVSFGASISTIGISAFEKCVSLQSLPKIDSLTEIGSLAFEGCTSLRYAEFGSSLEKIGMSAFRGCTSLAKISVAEDNQSYSSRKGCLCSKDGSRLIFCPQGFKGTLKTESVTKTIGNYAAMGCRGISQVILHGETSEIGRAAFLNCTDITSVSLPESVTSIGNAALGMYFTADGISNEAYFRIFGAEASSAEKYCADREISFIPYSKTLLASSERVVIAEGNTFLLTCGFISRKKADISWSSSDESVVTVRNGKLTAVSRGSAIITLSAEGFEDAEVKVSVISSESTGTGSKVTYNKRLMYCGENEELSSVFSQLIDPLFSSDKFWFTSDPSVATVTEDGTVYAHKSGTANILCRMSDGSENRVVVTVTDRPDSFVLLPVEGELTIGDTIAIRKKMLPSRSSDTVTWKSDNEDVASVDSSGRVTAVGQGDCTVTATAACGLKSSVAIKCVIPATGISLDQETRDVYQGKEFNLKASVIPEDSQQTIRWRSSDPTVATVNSKGKVKGVSFGTAVIYAETSGGLSDECRVNVVARAKELSLDVKKITLNCGSDFKLNAIVRPSYSPETTDKCTWNSTNEKVAVVDENGNVTAVGVGKCIINCRTSGDLISKCQVQVRMSAASVAIEAEKNSIYIGEVLPLRAVITPEDSTDSIEWLSDNADIAYVTSNGTVKGKSSGTATITTRLTNDVTGKIVSSSFEIKVMKMADSVRLSGGSLSMRVGDSDSLTFTMLPDDSNDTFRWYSTDDNVASVRDDGLITAVAPGTCYICIETGSGAEARCKVTVAGTDG